MHDSDRTREGYLVIADIAGYTRFLVGTELEHAQSIVEELTNLIRRRLVPPLRFVKLEGDAVFCYADARTLHEGESLVELLEVCYFEFSNLLFNMERATTCRCAACASIGSLDLKFVAHYGSFVAQRGAGGEDVAGPDVILVHRLLKNTITERTGIGAYVFFTGACMKRLPPRFELRKHSENYESFGETSGAIHDLGPVLEQMRRPLRCRTLRRSCGSTSSIRYSACAGRACSSTRIRILSRETSTAVPASEAKCTATTARLRPTAR